MPGKSSSGTEQFREGDRVRHKGDGVEGKVTDTAYSAPHFRVRWADGMTTLESFHTVERYVEADTERDRTIDVNVVSTVRVPEQYLNKDMSDEEITSQILKHGEFDSNEALAESISEIRKRVPEADRDV